MCVGGGGFVSPIRNRLEMGCFVTLLIADNFPSVSYPDPDGSGFFCRSGSGLGGEQSPIRTKGPGSETLDFPSRDLPFKECLDQQVIRKRPRFTDVPIPYCIVGQESGRDENSTMTTLCTPRGGVDVKFRVP